jgi:signal transduction histidine kinase
VRRQWRHLLQLSAARQLRILIVVLLVLISGLVVGALVTARGQQQTVRNLTLATGPGAQFNKDALLHMTEAQAEWTEAVQGAGPSGRYKAVEPQVEATLDRVATALGRKEIHRADRERYAALVERERRAVTGWFQAARMAEELGDRPAAERGAARALAFERFTTFRQANSEISALVGHQRDAVRASARKSIGIVLGVVALAAAGAVLLVLLAGRMVQASVLLPLERLRSVVQRQREGDVVVRADEHHGSAEIRALAADYNELVRRRQLLEEEQGRTLDIHLLTLEVARRVHAVQHIDQALEFVCSSLGQGLSVDRVLLYTVDDEGAVARTAQYHRADLPPLPQLPRSLMTQVAAVNDELRRDATVFRLPDLLAPEVRDEPRVEAFHRATGARSLLMVPIGVGEKGLGLLSLITVDLPRRWRRYEIQGVQQCVSYVAQGIVAAQLAQMQDEQVARLTALDRQKTDFMATVSHELRTPLTSISGYLELLEDGDYGSLTGPQLSALGVIGRNTARLRGLIEDLLVLNKIETSGLHSQPQDVAVGDMVSAVVEVLRPNAANGQVEIVAEPPAADLCVHVDRTQLERALINLGSNAVKFTPAGGRVTLSAERSGDRVAISVTDTGIGIPHDDLTRLGDRFFRASNATARAIPGTGLGLAIVRTIVEGHGGQMFVASAEGEGTTVRLFLPSAGALPGSAGAETAGASAQGASPTL